MGRASRTEGTRSLPGYGLRGIASEEGAPFSIVSVKIKGAGRRGQERVPSSCATRWYTLLSRGVGLVNHSSLTDLSLSLFWRFSL